LDEQQVPVDVPTEASPPDWNALYYAASSAFTPASPIVDVELFSGRITQVSKVIDAINQSGQHAVLYGERGVGKTSLANVLASFLRNSGAQVAVSKINCDAADTFHSACKKSLQELRWVAPKPTAGFSAIPEPVQHNLAEQLPESSGPNDVRVVLAGVNVGTILVFDEFDRLPLKHVRAFTDLIKGLSDYAVRSTIVIVGVADTIDQLIRDHASIERAIIQVLLPRMETIEIREILNKGAARLSMEFEQPAREHIAHLAHGLPHYAHLVGLHSVRSAIQRRSLLVQMPDVEGGVRASVENVQQSIKALYHSATASSHRTAIFQQVLLACALARKDPLSYFQAADVVKPLSKIMNKDYSIPAFARHLKKLCDDDRGPVLERIGPERRQRYRFRNPLFEPFIIMNGLSMKLINDESLAQLKSM
jgi:Cdc6-like AAA superfamily ATPase